MLPVLAGLVGVLLANIEFSILGPAGKGATVAVVVASALPGPPTTGYVLVTVGLAGTLAAVVYRETCTDPVAAQRRALLVIGGVVAFSAGGSQVGLAIGLLLPLLDSLSMSPMIVLAGGGLGLLLESWTGAPRMIKAISQDYSSLGPRRSIAALVPSFAIAQTAVLFGIPVSFNEIIISAIVGSGFATGDGGVSCGKILYTVLAWVASLALSLTVGYSEYLLLGRLLGG